MDQDAGGHSEAGLMHEALLTLLDSAAKFPAGFPQVAASSLSLLTISWCNGVGLPIWLKVLELWASLGHDSQE
jgi:hypothetical protein